MTRRSPLLAQLYISKTLKSASTVYWTRIKRKEAILFRRSLRESFYLVKKSKRRNMCQSSRKRRRLSGLPRQSFSRTMPLLRKLRLPPRSASSHRPKKVRWTCFSQSCMYMNQRRRRKRNQRISARKSSLDQVREAPACLWISWRAARGQASCPGSPPSVRYLHLLWVAPNRPHLEWIRLCRVLTASVTWTSFQPKKDP